MAGVWVDGAPFGTLGSEDTGTSDFWGDGAPEGGLPEFGTPSEYEVIRSDTVTVTEGCTAKLTPLVVRVFDAIQVVDVGEPDPLVGFYRYETPHVTDVLRVTLGVSRAVFDTITITERTDKTVKTPIRNTRRDVLFVRDVATVQAYINGGLGVRVSESITVAENPMYLGYAPVVGGPGNPDYSTLNIGPNPGMSLVDLGSDYWLAGV